MQSAEMEDAANALTRCGDSPEGFARQLWLGAGRNSASAYVELELSTGKRYAIKYMDRLIRAPGTTAYKNVVREIEGLACVQHANIVLGHSVCLTKTHIALVMELVPWTSGSDRAKTLADRLGLVGSPDPGDGALDEDTARKYFKQMTFAVDYLHACGIVHRDIKPDNILVTEKGDVKLIDLGWCRDVPAGPAPSTLVLGATAARAPEVESMRRYLPAGQQLPDDVATTPTDVWALGVCLHVMLAPSRLPFGTLCNLVEQQKLLDADNSYEPPEFVSADLVALLRSIFRVHPGPGLSPAGTPPRATARELLAQPWLAEAQPAECVLRPRPDGFDLRLATLMEQSQAPGAPLSIRFPLGAQ